MSSQGSGLLEDVRVGVRFKISALWIATLFLFAYGDIFGFFKPGQIEEVVGGEISGIRITEAFLFAISVYIAVASAMIFISLALRPSVARSSNIVVGAVYVVSIVVSAVGETSGYYLFLSAAEVVLLVLMIRYAWTWPRGERAVSDSAR